MRKEQPAHAGCTRARDAHHPDPITGRAALQPATSHQGWQGALSPRAPQGSGRHPQGPPTPHTPSGASSQQERRRAAPHAPRSPNPYVGEGGEHTQLPFQHPSDSPVLSVGHSRPTGRLPKAAHGARPEARTGALPPGHTRRCAPAPPTGGLQMAFLGHTGPCTQDTGHQGRQVCARSNHEAPGGPEPGGMRKPASRRGPP